MTMTRTQGESKARPAPWPARERMPKRSTSGSRAFTGADDHSSFVPIGPDTEQCVKFEPEGLRITLPRGHPKMRPNTGVAFPFAVKGDFEITVGFAILHEPEPADS